MHDFKLFLMVNKDLRANMSEVFESSGYLWADRFKGFYGTTEWLLFFKSQTSQEKCDEASRAIYFCEEGPMSEAISQVEDAGNAKFSGAKLNACISNRVLHK